MKLPDIKTQSSHKTNSLNTLTLTGLSILWGVMLQLISPWWLIGSAFLLMSGFGNEISERKKDVTTLSV
ncbi:MAG: hypothetical protein VW270_16965 [Candidatus Poseidoniales archaeon]